jgi:hypothetical protein
VEVERDERHRRRAEVARGQVEQRLDEQLPNGVGVELLDRLEKKIEVLRPRRRRVGRRRYEPREAYTASSAYMTD